MREFQCRVEFQSSLRRAKEKQCLSVSLVHVEFNVRRPFNRVYWAKLADGCGFWVEVDGNRATWPHSVCPWASRGAHRTMNARARSWFLLVVVVATATANGIANETCNVANTPDNAHVITVGLLTNAGGMFSDVMPLGVLISGAMRYAVEKVNREKLLGDRELRFVYNDTKGDTVSSIRAMTEQWKKHNATAFFGLEDSCYVEAYIASAWDLTAISCKCADAKVSNKEAFPSFARTHPPETKVTKSVIALLQFYQWKSVMIVHETFQRYERVAAKLKETAQDNNIETKMYQFESNTICCQDKKPCCHINVFAEAVENTYKLTRIYIFLGTRNNLIKIMSALYKKGLLQYGEYVVIYVELEEFGRDNVFSYIWDSLKSKEEMVEDDTSLNVAQSLLIIGPTLPNLQHYSEFDKNVSKFNAEPPFNFPEPLVSTGFTKKIPFYAAYLYDSVMLYVRSLNQTSNASVSGKATIRRLLNITYLSITGARNKIDENGDAEGNYSLYTMTTGVNYQLLNRTYDNFLALVGTFQDTNMDMPVFKQNNPILWVAGDPPDSEPPCGFDGLKCVKPPDDTRKIVSGVLTCVLVVVVVAAMVLYRNWKYEQEIAGLVWKILFKEIRPRANGILWSESKMSIVSQSSFESRIWHQVFTKVGTYKGTVVSIKELKFSKRMVDIPRETKKEMKVMREIRQDNINPFVGACVEPNRVYIINEYCSKGSLADILDNDDIKLDNMLTASLVWGLLKGMIYLHDSDLKVHGNLKSSNCVVTSRWVLQVTDFGLHQLHSLAEQEDKDEYRYHWGQLWLAPELLRNTEQRVQCTQKGDVYAFAIIMYEIMGRQGPYSNSQRQEFTPKEILSRVRDPVDCYYRPDTSILVCQSYIIACICDCWCEKPEHRPVFRHIRNRLKNMRAGMKANIFDHMLDIMENYANNLEKLVEERTCLLDEEKKKTEALLHRMLPPVVASQLMRGEMVQPEYFDKVTIYFSDIVGFTEMSAQSSPLEVVTFLSDLYTLFDEIIGDYEVYKVETIGDAYMVVSGLPIRNGDRHAGQIASMSIHLLEEVRKFKIRHRPDQTLRLRIGIHTGPVVAGVVGITMPRYCLFGDTVNTASRMESTGEALKIHISSHCKDILDNLGGYVIAERGTMKIKGKGDMQTFWLLNMSEDVTRRESAPVRVANRLSEHEIKRRSPKMCSESRIGANLQNRRYSSIPRVGDPESSLVSPPVGLPSFLVANRYHKQQGSPKAGNASRRRKSPRLGRSYSSDGEAGRSDLKATMQVQEETETSHREDVELNGNSGGEDAKSEKSDNPPIMTIGNSKHVLPNGRATVVKDNDINSANGTCPEEEEEVSSPLLTDHCRLDAAKENVKRWRSCDAISPVREKSLFRNIISGLFGSRDGVVSVNGDGDGNEVSQKPNKTLAVQECRLDSESMV